MVGNVRLLVIILVAVLAIAIALYFPRAKRSPVAGVTGSTEPAFLEEDPPRTRMQDGTVTWTKL
jgi:hypothetical protein